MNIDELNQKGIDIFINPQPLYSFEKLVFGVDFKGKKMKVLSSNTYRGFHRVDKSKPGPKVCFDECLIVKKDRIIKTLTDIPSEDKINDLENEIIQDLRKLLKNNISEKQLNSFNKTRKPIDIVIGHSVAMLEDLNSSARSKIVPHLFLPLDSQMFKSEIVFSDDEILKLGLKRSFTFNDIKLKKHYNIIQEFLKEKADRLGLKGRIFFDLVYNNRWKKAGRNIFETNL